MIGARRASVANHARRPRSSAAALLAIATLVVAALATPATAAADPPLAASATQSAASDVVTQPFTCANGTTEIFTVPSWVHAITATLIGGHGGVGGYSENSDGNRGLAGEVQAVVAVHPGEQLLVTTGCEVVVGRDGGAGFTRGGTGGKADSGAGSGGGGGGSSGIAVRPADSTHQTVLLVAGGGGGGGGQGEAGASGGDGGNGGVTPQHGGDGGPTGGEGGDGGGASSGNGDSGAGGTFFEGGGGAGGGGGYPHGGGGADKGQYTPDAGGGGGGGASYADPAWTSHVAYSTATLADPGSVSLTYPAEPAKVAVRSGAGQQVVIGQRFPLPLSALVTYANGDPAPGVTVTFTLPSHDFGQKWATFDGRETSATATTGSNGVATSPPLTAGNGPGDAGTWTATATVGSVRQPARFTMANLASQTATELVSSTNPSQFSDTLQLTATVRAQTEEAGTPTGSVQFVVDGKNLDGPQPLANGAATVPAPSSLAVGKHRLQAQFLGDTNFDKSAASLTQQVDTLTTATSLDAAESVTFGVPQSFDVSVAAQAGATQPPLGKAQFTVNGDDLGGPENLAVLHGTVTGAQSVPVTLPEAGSYQIGVDYSPASSSIAASSATLHQTVRQAPTNTAVALPDNPAKAGEPVPLTADVDNGAWQLGSEAAPEGTVQFYVDAKPVGTPVPLTPGVPESTATTTSPALLAGAHQVRAVYHGDGNFVASSGTATLVVGAQSTLLTLSSSSNPSEHDKVVAFTAKVVAPGSVTPTGSVQFSVDGVPLGSPQPLNSDGIATQLTPKDDPLGIGWWNIKAVYGGNGSFGPSSDTLTQYVYPWLTTAQITSSSLAPETGAPVTFTAHLAAAATGGGAPTGTVQFRADSADLGARVALGPDGTASVTAPHGLPPGEHQITATYAGDGHFGPASPSFSQQTVPAHVRTTVSTSSVDDPSVFGQQLVFRADVRTVDPHAGEPAGAVAFSLDGRPLGGPARLAGDPTSTSPPVGSLAGGVHRVVADYAGGAGFWANTRNRVQVVAAAPTTLSLTARPSPADAGEAVTVTARVTVPAPGGGTPTGTVQFLLHGRNLGGPVRLENGRASTAPITGLASGEHDLAAVYSGAADFEASGDVLTEVVRPPTASAPNSESLAATGSPVGGPGGLVALGLLALVTGGALSLVSRWRRLRG